MVRRKGDFAAVRPNAEDIARVQHLFVLDDLAVNLHAERRSTTEPECAFRFEGNLGVMPGNCHPWQHDGGILAATQGNRAFGFDGLGTAAVANDVNAQGHGYQ